MTLTLLTVVPIGLLGLLAGAVAIVRGHRTAAIASAGLGLLTMGTSVAVHGWQLMAAFDAVASIPAEAKQQHLADNISAAMSTLPLGFGLALACVVVSGIAWWRQRRAEPDADEGSAPTS